MSMVINPNVELSESEQANLILAQRMSPNYTLTGIADLHSEYLMPIWRSRKLCKQEAKSKYIPHQGKQECARRKRTMATLA